MDGWMDDVIQRIEEVEIVDAACMGVWEEGEWYLEIRNIFIEIYGLYIYREFDRHTKERTTGAIQRVTEKQFDSSISSYIHKYINVSFIVYIYIYIYN